MKKKKLRKFFDFLLYGFFGLVLFVVIVVIFTNITTGNANFFGLKIYSIKTNSMSPNYPAGSLILETTKFKVEKIEKGDVITFDMNIKDYDIPNTHRVVGFYYYDNKDNAYASAYEYDNFDSFYQDYDKTRYQIVGFRTKGDNPSLDDDGNPLYPIDANPVYFDKVEAKFVFELGFVAAIYNLVITPLGFILIVLIPMATVIVVQVINTVRIYKKKDKEEEKKIEVGSLEEKEIAKKAIEEYKKKHNL